MTLRTIGPHQARRLMDEGAVLLGRPGSRRIRARTHSGRPPSALSRLDDAELATDHGHAVIFHCSSGARTRAMPRARGQGRRQLRRSPARGRAGRLAQGWPATVTDRRQPIELQRQVQIGAGGLALLGTVLGLSVSPWFFAVPLFVGGGLLLAGLTGFCGMAVLLQRAPWNRAADVPARKAA